MRLRGENILGMSSHDIPPTHSSDHVIFGTFICFKTVSHAANRCYFKQTIKLLFQNCVICLVAEIAISSFLRQLDIFLFRKQNKNKTRIIQTRQRFVLILIIDFSEIEFIQQNNKWTILDWADWQIYMFISSTRKECIDTKRNFVYEFLTVFSLNRILFFFSAYKQLERLNLMIALFFVTRCSALAFLWRRCWHCWLH